MTYRDVLAGTESMHSALRRALAWARELDSVLYDIEIVELHVLGDALYLVCASEQEADRVHHRLEEYGLQHMDERGEADIYENEKMKVAVTVQRDLDNRLGASVLNATWHKDIEVALMPNTSENSENLASPGPWGMVELRPYERDERVTGEARTWQEALLIASRKAEAMGWLK